VANGKLEHDQARWTCFRLPSAHTKLIVRIGVLPALRAHWPDLIVSLADRAMCLAK
jgi:hypothetical protein